MNTLELCMYTSTAKSPDTREIKKQLLDSTEYESVYVNQNEQCTFSMESLKDAFHPNNSAYLWRGLKNRECWSKESLFLSVLFVFL